MSQDDADIPARATFWETFRDRCDVAGEQMLHDIPELDEVVIIPSWVIQQTVLPLAVIKTRVHDPQRRSIAATVRTTRQLQATLQQQVEHMREILVAYDQEAGRLAKEIHAQRVLLTKLAGEIDDRRTELEQTPAARQQSVPPENDAGHRQPGVSPG